MDLEKAEEFIILELKYGVPLFIAAYLPFGVLTTITTDFTAFIISFLIFPPLALWIIYKELDRFDSLSSRRILTKAFRNWAIFLILNISLVILYFLLYTWTFSGE